MNPDTKSIGLGLLIGGGIAVVLMLGAFIAGFLPPAPQPPPTAQIETPAIFSFAPDVAPMWTPAPVNTSMPTPSPTPDPEAVLAGQILQSLPGHGGDWNILIREDGVRDVFSHNADRKNHIGSIIKLPFAMLFFKSLEEKGIPPSEYAEYLSTRGIGRTYMQLLKAMLVESEEASAKTLREFIRESGTDVNAALKSWGASRTDLSSRHSTPEDIAALYESLYFGRAVTPEARAIILDLMSTYTASDSSRLGVIRALLPPGGKFYNKRATVTAGRLIVGDSALLAWDQNGQEKVYVIVVLGYNGKLPTTDVKLSQGIETIARLFWDFAIAENP